VSKDRQRARAARQEARRHEVAAAASARARRERRAALRQSLTPALPRRRRRFGSLTGRQRFQLVTAFLTVQAATWWLLPGWASRGALAVLTLAVLAVVATTRRRPAR